MSTSYFIVCKKCKVAVEVGSWGLSGFQFYRDHPDCMAKLHKLMEEHTIGEHDIGVLDEGYIYDDEAWKLLKWEQ